MPGIQELTDPSPSSPSETGTGESDYKSLVTFKEYKRKILPLDGFIFWLATGIEKTVSGSVSYLTKKLQKEGESYEQSRVLFTTNEEVKPFHATSDTTWVGAFNDLRFVLGLCTYEHKETELYHYIGKSLSPAFARQFVDNADDINDQEPIVSNSLPIFLSLPSEGNPYLDRYPWPENVPVFPSFLVPDNQPPPYVTVHNDAESIKGIGMSAINITDSSGTQITSERVRLSLYGLSNTQAGNIREYIIRWALIHPWMMGVMNNPVISDARETSPNITTLAQKKTIDFDVMYQQNALRNSAVQLIRQAKINLEVKNATNSHN